jgi:hypothetical protein
VKFWSRKNPKYITSGQLEVKLRCLSDIEVVPTLQAKLLAAVPSGNFDYGLEKQRYLRFYALGSSTAAAIVMIFISVFSYYSNAFTSGQGFVIDPTDTSRFNVTANCGAFSEFSKEIPGTNEPMR